MSQHLIVNILLFAMAALAMAAITKTEVQPKQRKPQPQRAPIRISFNLKRNRYDLY